MAAENRGPELLAVGVALLTTAVVTTLLRCYTRIAIVKRFGFDDCCMIAAVISFALFVTCALVGIHYGTGRHWWTLEDDEITNAMKFWWLCYLWYCTTMIASKISIGYFLLRITVRRIDLLIIYGVMVVTVLTGIIFFFLTLFQCWPVEFFWDKTIEGGSCIDINVIVTATYVYSAFSVVCDFTFALLPIVLIWKLNMNTRTKMALVPIMTMACVASAAIVVRFVYVKDFKNPDFLYATVDIAIWSTAEQGLAITAGSLATLRPLVNCISQTLHLTAGSQLRDTGTDGRQNPGIRTFGQSSKSRRLDGALTLTTFPGREEQYSLESGPDSNENPQTSSPSYKKKGGPIWSTSRVSSHGDNDSEERLHVTALRQGPQGQKGHNEG